MRFCQNEAQRKEVSLGVYAFSFVKLFVYKGLSNYRTAIGFKKPRTGCGGDPRSRFLEHNNEKLFNHCKSLVDDLLPCAGGAGSGNRLSHEVAVAVRKEGGRYKGYLAHKAAVKHGGRGDIHLVACAGIVNNLLNRGGIAGAILCYANNVNSLAFYLTVHRTDFGDFGNTGVAVGCPYVNHRQLVIVE